MVVPGSSPWLLKTLLLRLKPGPDEPCVMAIRAAMKPSNYARSVLLSLGLSIAPPLKLDHAIDEGELTAAEAASGDGGDLGATLTDKPGATPASHVGACKERPHEQSDLLQLLQYWWPNLRPPPDTMHAGTAPTQHTDGACL